MKLVAPHRPAPLGANRDLRAMLRTPIEQVQIMLPVLRAAVILLDDPNAHEAAVGALAEHADFDLRAPISAEQYTQAPASREPRWRP